MKTKPRAYEAALERGRRDYERRVAADRAEFAPLLDLLKANDGAVLYWQVPPSCRPDAAIEAGVVSFDAAHDLLVHPFARRADAGAYAMPVDEERFGLQGRGPDADEEGL